MEMMRPHIRWTIKRDLPAIVDIDYRAYIEEWSEDDYTNALRKRSMIGLTVEDDADTIVGLCLYELDKNKFTIVRLAIDPRRQRRGFGTALMDKMKSKIGEHRTYLEIRVGDDMLWAHLFLKAMGFVAVVDGDEYLFTWREA